MFLTICVIMALYRASSKAYRQKIVKDIDMGFSAIDKGRAKVQGKTFKMGLTCLQDYR